MILKTAQIHLKPFLSIFYSVRKGLDQIRTHIKEEIQV